MSLLRSIEERITRLVEGSFGKVFRTSVQPVELARRLVSEMDDHQQRTVRKVFVPNVYGIFLSERDHAQFEGHERALTTELAEYLTEHARRQGYTLVTRPRVSLQVDPDLSLGSFGIASSLDETAQGALAEADVPPASATTVQPVVVAPPVPVAAAVARDWLLVTPDGPRPLVGRLAIGRGKANDVVLTDSSVSREHAEVVETPAGPVVRDLDSTNGVLVNGSRVREQALAAGDRLRLGNVELRVEVAGA